MPVAVTWVLPCIGSHTQSTRLALPFITSVNSQQTINSGFADIIYWNGRNDTLWSQIVAVVESYVSINGSRLRVAWRIADAYRAEYTALFPDYPLPPELDSVAMQKTRLAADGTKSLRYSARSMGLTLLILAPL